MINIPKTNCYEETSYYADDERIVQKRTVRVEPAQDRERIACLPVIFALAERNNLNIDPKNIEWDEVGRDKPDGIVHEAIKGEFWVEHTRISDHYQHFINESLKSKSDKVLDDLNAPRNLFIRYPQNTQVKAAQHFCRTWQDWEEISSISEAMYILKHDYTAGLKTIKGYKILESSDIVPRIYMLESPKQNIEDMFTNEIKTKEAKYGLLAYKTILIIDDETRAYYPGEVMEAARKYGLKNKSTFKGVYVVAFTGLEDGSKPHWLIQPIKEC